METGEGGVPEKSIDIERWGYDSHLRPYLTLLAHKKFEALEASRNFPKRIDWGSPIHWILNMMREETSDGFERFTPITYRKDLQDIYVPSEFIKGNRTSIHPENYDQAMAQPEQIITPNTVYALGDIHSHPAVWNVRGAKFLHTTRITPGGGFSVDDLFRMVEPGSSLFLAGVVDRFENFFVFRTRETTIIQQGSPLSSTEAFRHYWLRKHQMLMVGGTTVMLKPFDQWWRVNMSIAKEYNLALYKGNPREDLVRHYP